MDAKLSEKEFDILNGSLSLSDEQKGFSQRDLSRITGFSLGTVNRLVSKLFGMGLLSSENRVTDDGMRALEPFKVKNAIIMAAGMSSRFAPLSYEKPKGLFTVKGDIIIERQIRQLKEAGIGSICIVVGYMQEKFFYLEDKFGVDIVVNEDFYRYNNTSSLIRVLDRLSNTYICSSDDYFTENVFERYVYDSYYASSFQNGVSDEWGIITNAKGRIVAIDHKPKDMHIMLGHAYFSDAFSKKFSKLLREQYDSDKVRKELWEGFLESNLKELEICERRYADGIINEFDSLDELRAFDDRYVNDSGSVIFENISKTLGIEEKDISGIKVIKNGLTNLSFVFSVRDRKERYVYRHPGVGTEKYISRKSEAFSESIAKKLGLDSTIIYIEPDEGWKISLFIEDAHVLDYSNDDEVDCAIAMLKKLHDQKLKSDFDFDIRAKTEEFESMISGVKTSFEDYSAISKGMKMLYELTRRDAVEPVLCHCDSYSPNFLVDPNGNMSLIDWEYSGNDDPASDLGTFIACSDWTVERAGKCIESYLGENVSAGEIAHFTAYVAIASYYWFVWALYQESIGNLMGEWLYLWYVNTKTYMKKGFELYGEKGDM